MIRRLGLAFAVVLLIAGAVFLGCAQSGQHSEKTRHKTSATIKNDSVGKGAASSQRYEHLTDADFEKVARQLEVETAAIKAVVSIEAGSAMKGFWAPGVPIINFDPTMYRKYAPKALDKAGDKNAKVPAGLTGYALREWTQLTNARKNNLQGADMGTFWGMFQIGGFNYKVCGCKSVEEFVRRMSHSELEQLELFAEFLVGTGYVRDLRAKNWSSFARKYNGPSYAKRGYHTKMASAYSKFKSQESKNKKAPVPDGKLAGKELKLN
ncbi:MAG: N-acetylmuramidase family protein [Muribaculaceae bacterium]|nr:N-acetylmuramidase family protein [Muribaculaceae bacterium]